MTAVRRVPGENGSCLVCGGTEFDIPSPGVWVCKACGTKITAVLPVSRDDLAILLRDVLGLVAAHHIGEPLFSKIQAALRSISRCDDIGLASPAEKFKHFAGK